MFRLAIVLHETLARRHLELFDEIAYKAAMITLIIDELPRAYQSKTLGTNEFHNCRKLPDRIPCA